MFLFREAMKEAGAVSQVFHTNLKMNFVQTDRIFKYLLVVQWLFVIACACLVSPTTWEGADSWVHPHVWLAIFLGGLITAFPVHLAAKFPGRISTRLTVASAQVMISALLIHILGGRIEAHFHIFVSLALLAAYRDRLVFVPAVLLVTIDHFIRGFLFPLSVFGVSTVVPWRPFEHTAWVLFETACLFFFVGQNLRQFWTLAELQCSLLKEKKLLESRVLQRTKELDSIRLFQERVLNSIDAHLCILDSQGQILFVNDKWLQHGKENGVENDWEPIGRNYLEFCENVTGEAASISHQTASAIRQIIRGERANFMAEYSCPSSDKERWFHIRINQVEQDDEVCVVVAHVDISDIKLAQSRAASLAKLVLESPNELYIFSRETLQFLEVNKGACLNLGYSRSELLSMAPLDIQPEMDSVQFHQLLLQLNQSKANSLQFETIHRRKNGSDYSCSISLHNGTFESQDVLIAFVRDQTEQKQLENRLRQSQKLESIGQLAAGIAHEINSPMQCVFSNVEFLHRSFDRVTAVTDRFIQLLESNEINWSSERAELQDLREEYRYDYLREQSPLALQEAADASKRVISIVRAMRTMSHPGTAQKVPSDIHELLRNAATITRNRWKYVAQLEFDFDEKLKSAHVLPAELSQVFINLLVNAADAISEKAGSEPRELGQITIQTKLLDDRVFIKIQDTGAGIPESVRQRIFDPFFTTKGVGKGTGQGLAITYDAITNKHHGTIDVISSEGIGSSFLIHLPKDAAVSAVLPEVVEGGVPVFIDSQSSV